MPAKRKHTNDNIAEEPAPKRTLRSSKTPQISTPQTSKPPRTQTRATAKKPVKPTSKPICIDESEDLDPLPEQTQSIGAVGDFPDVKVKGSPRAPKKAVLDSKTSVSNESCLQKTPLQGQRAAGKRGKKPIATLSASSRESSPVEEKTSDIAPKHTKNYREIRIPPVELASCIAAQKRAVLQALQTTVLLPTAEDSPQTANDIASQQLLELLQGTVGRAEGNSCLILGPRGSGKSAVLNECINTNFQNQAIVIRLCGWLQSTDRHALRELAIQLLHQTGTSLLSGLQDGENGPQEETMEGKTTVNDAGLTGVNLPPSSQLHSLIPVLSSLNRPVIIVLDAFDLFALHPRQSLLYCLLDAAQNCRASPENKGMAVIGISSRIDTIQLLEKRVKSRFSGRTLRTAPPITVDQWQTFSRHMLLPKVDETSITPEWQIRWASSVEKFMDDESVQLAFQEMYSITRDLSTLRRVLLHTVTHLSHVRPFLDFDVLQTAMKEQRRRPSQLNLHVLSYPALCLLVAITHVETSGHLTFTFEMLLEKFQEQVRSSSSAPVQLNGGSIGMMRCSREILMSAFEGLVAARLLLSVNATTTTPKAFLKHRCVIEREDIRKAIENSGQTNLKKWLTKS